MDLVCRVLLPLLLTSFVGAQCITAELLVPNLPSCATTGFGETVAIDGDTAVVGAWAAAEGPGTTCGLPESGRLFVFQRNPNTSTWTLTDEIGNPIGGDAGRFGRRVAIRGNTIAVLGSAHRAWVLVKVGSTWQSATLTLPRNYPRSIAISDDMIAIGFAEPGAVGQVWLYGKPPAGWTSVASHAPGVTLTSPAADAGNFGYDIALGMGPTQGPRLAVAADVSGFQSSRVYVYELFIGQWIPAGEFSMSFPVRFMFGGKVDLHGDVAVFAHPSAQACWVFVRDSLGVWTQRWLFQRGGGFGHDVALSRDLATAGRVVVTAVDQGTPGAFVYDPVDPSRLDAWTMRTLPVPGAACNVPLNVALSGPLVVVSDTCNSSPTPAHAFYLGGPRTVGGFVSYGTSCQGTGGLRPVHTMSGTPDVGYQINWEVANARPSAPAAVLIGIGRLNTPLDAIGMTGCYLHVMQFFSIGGLTDGTGQLTIPTTIPCGAVSAVGGQLQSQMAIVDLGAVHRLKVVSTNGMEMTIGGHR